MKKALIKIREFFWPLLEKDDKAPSKVASDADNGILASDELIDIQISDESLEEAFKLKLRIFDSEEERRKSIESKSSLFISTISVATSIVVAANALITGNQEYNLPIKVSVAVSFVLSVYAVRTVWFSIKALERGTYNVIGFKDINVKGTKPQYYKSLIQTIQKKANKNQDTINRKVDYFTMAQEYYKRAICVICIYSFLILLFCLLFKKSSGEKPPGNIINVDKIEIYKMQRSNSQNWQLKQIPIFDNLDSQMRKLDSLR